MSPRTLDSKKKKKKLFNQARWCHDSRETLPPLIFYQRSFFWFFWFFFFEKMFFNVIFTNTIMNIDKQKNKIYFVKYCESCLYLCMLRKLKKIVSSPNENPVCASNFIGNWNSVGQSTSNFLGHGTEHWGVFQKIVQNCWGQGCPRSIQQSYYRHNTRRKKNDNFIVV